MHYIILLIECLCLHAACLSRRNGSDSTILSYFGIQGKAQCNAFFFNNNVFNCFQKEICSVFKVCRNPFNEDLYEQLRSYLYIYGRGKMNNRQLLSLCEVLYPPSPFFFFISPSSSIHSFKARNFLFVGK